MWDCNIHSEASANGCVTESEACLDSQGGAHSTIIVANLAGAAAAAVCRSRAYAREAKQAFAEASRGGHDHDHHGPDADDVDPDDYESPVGRRKELVRRNKPTALQQIAELDQRAQLLYSKHPLAYTNFPLEKLEWRVTATFKGNVQPELYFGDTNVPSFSHLTPWAIVLQSAVGMPRGQPVFRCTCAVALLSFFSGRIATVAGGNRGRCVLCDLDPALVVALCPCRAHALNRAMLNRLADIGHPLPLPLPYCSSSSQQDYEGPWEGAEVTMSSVPAKLTRCVSIDARAPLPCPIRRAELLWPYMRTRSSFCVC